METITLKDYWSIIRVDGLYSFFLFLVHRMKNQEPWLVHQCHDIFRNNFQSEPHNNAP